MSRPLILLYGLAAYAIFFVTFLYAIGFTGNLVVPKSIDSGQTVGLGESLVVNLILLGVFAIQHTIMARPAFKRWFTRIIPEAAERSTFVLASSLALILLYWQWRPMTGSVWSLETPALRAVLWSIFAIGWLLVLASTFLINHFDLFGLRQVYKHFSKQEYRHIQFVKQNLYHYLRHPIMLGFIIAFWATPDMTVGHLLFAIGTTGYILVGIRFEEHDMRAYVGEEYDAYREEVPMLCPIHIFRKKKAPSDDGATASSSTR